MILPSLFWFFIKKKRHIFYESFTLYIFQYDMNDLFLFLYYVYDKKYNYKIKEFCQFILSISIHDFISVVQWRNISCDKSSKINCQEIFHRIMNIIIIMKLFYIFVTKSINLFFYENLIYIYQVLKLYIKFL